MGRRGEVLLERAAVDRDRPVPGRRRTRATASLRRPVVWVGGSGFVTCRSFFRALGRRRSGPVPGRSSGCGLLGLVRVLGAGVDHQLLQLLAAEACAAGTMPRTARRPPPRAASRAGRRSSPTAGRRGSPSGGRRASSSALLTVRTTFAALTTMTGSPVSRCGAKSAVLAAQDAWRPRWRAGRARCRRRRARARPASSRWPWVSTCARAVLVVSWAGAAAPTGPDLGTAGRAVSRTAAPGRPAPTIGAGAAGPARSGRLSRSRPPRGRGPRAAPAPGGPGGPRCASRQ